MGRLIIAAILAVALAGCSTAPAYQPEPPIPPRTLALSPAISAEIDAYAKSYSPLRDPITIHWALPDKVILIIPGGGAYAISPASGEAVRASANEETALRAEIQDRTAVKSTDNVIDTALDRAALTPIIRPHTYGYDVWVWDISRSAHLVVSTVFGKLTLGIGATVCVGGAMVITVLDAEGNYVGKMVYPLGCDYGDSKSVGERIGWLARKLRISPDGRMYMSRFVVFERQGEYLPSLLPRSAIQGYENAIHYAMDIEVRPGIYPIYIDADVSPDWTRVALLRGVPHYNDGWYWLNYVLELYPFNARVEKP